MQIARYYVEQRGIPEANIVALPMPVEETITVQQYVDYVFNPLLGKLLELGWVQGVRNTEPDSIGRYRMSMALQKTSYLVLTKGVPLRFKNALDLMETGADKAPKILQVNRGSVDSDLVTLSAPSNLPLASLLKNPLFDIEYPSAQDLSQFFRVSRLDGASVESVKSLIDDTLLAEKIGLRGRAVIDLGGPHARGDDWIRETGELTEAAHFDTYVEESKRVVDFRDRMDGVAIYMGWYRASAYGPFRRPQFESSLGAIGFHLHSFSAVTVRNPKKAWIASFVERGFCVTVGNVYEPYLDFTHRPERMLKVLLDGRTFGEAVAYSMPVLSWMGVAVGDPLYRPFALTLEEQLKNETDSRDLAYVVIREVNRLYSVKGLESAVEYGRLQLLKNPSLALSLKMADLYLEAKQLEDVVRTLGVLQYINRFELVEVAMVQAMADRLMDAGEAAMAFDVYQKLIEMKNLGSELRMQLLEAGKRVAFKAGNTSKSNSWGHELAKMQTAKQK